MNPHKGALVGAPGGPRVSLVIPRVINRGDIYSPDTLCSTHGQPAFSGSVAFNKVLVSVRSGQGMGSFTL